MDRLTDKVAIVTGAAGGLGFAGVRAMAAEGARVVMMDLSPVVRDRANELIEEGFDVAPFVGDVTSERDMSGVVTYAQETCGGLHVFWNNAGLVSAEWINQDTDVVGISREYLMRTLDVNLVSVFLGSKFAVPAMARSGGGSIINTSSIQAAGGDLALAAYGTSKAAVNYLTKSVATSFGHLGIRSNALAPGLIPTPAGKESASGTHELEAVAPLQLLLDSQMLNTIGEQADVANTAVFLASDESKFITGQLIYVDGGATGHLPTLSDRRRANS